MNTEQLDHVLLDRALGALSPEVAALLDAYLATNAQAAKRATEYAQATQLTRELLCEASAGAADNVPPFPRKHIRQMLDTRRRFAIALRITAAAACVTLGFGVASLRTTSPSAATAAHATTPPSSIHWLASSTDAAKRRERLISLAATIKHEPSRPVIWTSPIELPTLGEAR